MSPAVAVSHPWPDDDEWRADAACRTMDPSIFYPVPVGNSSAVKAARRLVDPYAAARAVCSSCPVADECLSFALAIRDREGMYGGKSPDERRRILRRRWGAGR
jgi:WhiB family redox-sensing transcriptional regulator